MNKEATNCPRFFQCLLVALAAVACGCQSVRECSLTGRLWEHGTRSFCQPLANPNLALFDAKTDVLVQYSAISDRHDGVLRRSYFLDANRDRINAGKAPHFYHWKPHRDWASIPVNARPSEDANILYFAMAGGKSFTMFRPERPPEVCQLPEFCDDWEPWPRVALTPLAVTGDVLIFSAVVGFVSGYEYLQGGGPNFH